jgi:hypothetical protein
MKDNQKLEKALTSRHIPDFVLNSGGNRDTVDSREFDTNARQYADVSVTIQFVPDIEALRLADDFRRLALRESWKVRAANSNAAGVPLLEIEDGISIYTWAPTPETARFWNMLAGHSQPNTPDEQAYVAGYKLANFVRSLDIDASHLSFEFAEKHGILTTFDRKPGDICILIGMRPIENTLRDLEWEAETRELQKQQTQGVEQCQRESFRQRAAHEVGAAQLRQMPSAKIGGGQALEIGRGDPQRDFNERFEINGHNLTGRDRLAAKVAIDPGRCRREPWNHSRRNHHHRYALAFSVAAGNARDA